MTHHRRHGNNDTGTYDAEMTTALSPAQRYAAFKQTQAKRQSVSSRFARSMPFELDDFQVKANDALEAGDNVLVAAPTGAGKTVVADFAIYLAQERNVKAFYTTPIKALSNQKYHDLVETYGPDRVGLLTGDTSINSEADIVVMTTEVLRNMLYEHSMTLDALRYVILDEVHYLADRFRGPVWEEVIIHLPQSVRIIGLSATVSNVEDFSKWIESVRGDTTLVVSEKRPVPLEQHVLVQADDHTEPELIDLYRRDKDGNQTDKLNAQLVSRLDQLDRKAAKRRGEQRPDRRKGGKGGKWNDHSRRPERHTPRRWAVIDELNFLGILPGIYFIFSRNGCDQAVEQCINAGLELTTDDEVRRIRRIVDEMVEGQLSQEDLKALHFSQFRFALEEGFAPHHAGMVALFRQIVERLFEEGLVKVVFATETLALGINMPARCVVVEKLEKFDGTGHVGLTPGSSPSLPDALADVASTPSAMRWLWTIMASFPPLPPRCPASACTRCTPVSNRRSTWPSTCLIPAITRPLASRLTIPSRNGRPTNPPGSLKRRWIRCAKRWTDTNGRSIVSSAISRSSCGCACA